MITLHWTLLIFIPIVILLIIAIYKDFSEDSGMFGGIIGMFCLIVLIAVIAIYGGIFWW